MGESASTTASYRARYRAEKIGRRYSGWAHFAFTNISSLAVIGFAVAHVDHPSWKELLVIPISFFISNAVEYLGHRGPMHRRRRGLFIVFRRHTLEHHHFFTHELMSYEGSRDFKVVLFPPVMLLFFLSLATPIGLVLFVLISANAGWLFVAVAIGYYLSYEWLHFAYHLPESSRLGQVTALKALRAHHQAHHNPELMGRWNFNITFPICDRLFRTCYRKEGSAS